MNLAITLLVAVAIASVIGTVLQQNEPYQNYIIKFGPFWFEVFETLGLYDVYSAGWFLAILAFLVASTSVCIYRNGPNMLRDMSSWRLNVQLHSLRAFRHRSEWEVQAEPAQVEAALTTAARARGYRLRRQEKDGRLLLAAMKGNWNRMGYLFTHTAIVVICVGGLVDGNIPLKVKELTGQLRVETRDIPASQVPQVSWLPVGNPSFRGSITIPEGTSANLVFLRMRDGYLIQPLPFTVEVTDFRIEHYFTGQPKSFESDLVIHDPELDEPLETTIAVNHPLFYRGYAFYQASFSDGGTRMRLQALPLAHAQPEGEKFEGEVFDTLPVETTAGPLQIELTDFRLFNINPMEEEGERQFRNFGPSFTFKVRDIAGNALEYENYMAPVELEGRLFYLSGVRGSPNEQFHFLHIPADPLDGGLDRFLRFNASLHDEERVRRIAHAATQGSFDQVRMENPTLARDVEETMVRLVGLFARDGFDAVVEQVEHNVLEDRRDSVLDAYLRVLHTILAGLYEDVLRQEGVEPRAGLSDADIQFFDDALNAMASIGVYGAPFYLQLLDFDHIQATGLQIARAPGKNVVYLGFTLLCIGIFLMFYVARRRLWFWVDTSQAGTRVLLAGAANRNTHDFEQEFTGLAGALDGYFQGLSARRTGGPPPAP